MARQKKSDKKPIEQYEHKDKERLNNPPVGLVTPETDKDTGKKKYAYDPHLDPTLQWAGKAEHTSFEVPTVSLHVHERIDPRTIIQAVRKKNGSKKEQMSLFQALGENPPLREAIEFYKHRHNWSNRLIAGDSLLVMNSLIEKEGLAGQVQMVYFDPPYGIKYGSNFQPFTNKRDVKDGKDEDLTSEPEMIKAFRDTWELGIHSYLTYLRDRLLLARELLHESGSIFVQISDENVHLVRNLMDEVFGVGNFICIVTILKRSPQPDKNLSVVSDYLIYYGKSKENTKYRQLFLKKTIGEEGSSGYDNVLLRDGTVRRITDEEIVSSSFIPEGAKVFARGDLTSSHFYNSPEFTFNGKQYSSGKRYWSTSIEGLENLAKAGRIIESGNGISYIRCFDDFPFRIIGNIWTDTNSGFMSTKIYVVQTLEKIVQRCLLMTTDPGDLVLDITCGSGTTAAVAEQWGRRWITCDTSRGSITLAKQRLMTALFDYYQLAHPAEGVGSGFKYKTVPHVTLKSIANNEPSGQETLYDQPFADNSLARVTGPFTVEAVPAPMVKSIDDIVVPENPPSPPFAKGGKSISPTLKKGDIGGLSDIYQVEVLGFDYYNTKTGNIESGGTDKIAVWMLDTDYDGRSLYPRQVFFPMSGEKDGWSRLAKNLKAEIDIELIEAYRGTVSLPFEIGDNKRVAVKIVDDRGIESLRLLEVE